MSEFVGTKIFFKEAIWFVLTSSILFTDNALIPLRQHAFVQDYLLELNELNCYPISRQDLQIGILTKMMLNLLQQCKKDSYFREKIQALYRAHLLLRDENDNPVYVFFNELIDMSTYSEAQINEIKYTYEISRRVKPSLSATNIDIGILNPCKISFPTFEDVWSDAEEYVHYACEININTCRPRYRLPKGRTWEDAFNEFYVNSPRVLSLNKYFGEYVVEYGEYPCVYQLIIYTWKRESGKGMDSLPSTIWVSCELIIRDYERIKDELEPAEFARRFDASVNRVERERLERL
jgi:hypothetical protein